MFESALSQPLADPVDDPEVDQGLAAEPVDDEGHAGAVGEHIFGGFVRSLRTHSPNLPALLKAIEAAGVAGSGGQNGVFFDAACRGLHISQGLAQLQSGAVLVQSTRHQIPLFTERFPQLALRSLQIVGKRHRDVKQLQSQSVVEQQALVGGLADHKGAPNRRGAVVPGFPQQQFYLPGRGADLDQSWLFHIVSPVSPIIFVLFF